MTSAAFELSRRSRVSYGPWLWGSRIDLGLFGGSALVALGLVWFGQLSGLSQGPFPEWGWLVFVLGIDVAHVYATLFRTYLDPTELRRAPLRYSLVPLAVFALGAWLYSWSALMFWRVFAYTAVFHFIRQQAGWVAIYRAKSRMTGAVDRWLDQGVVYAATLYPLVHWHAHLEDTRFAWFVQGDFVDVGKLCASVLPVFEVAWCLVLVAFLARQAALFWTRRALELGKITVVLSTVAIWYIGIVATNNDFAFTVTNVIVHGIPYFALLWAYTRERAREAPHGFAAELAQKGFLAFLGFLVCLAFAEELLWDRLVFQERVWLFGDSRVRLDAALLGWVVPLLMVPQATHYVLDGMLWRRGDTRRLPAQRRALGFDVGPERASRSGTGGQ